MAKCYFAKHKLVWEVLDGGLKNKIEIQWSDIMALKANYTDDAPGTLDVVVINIILLCQSCLSLCFKRSMFSASTISIAAAITSPFSSFFSWHDNLFSLGRLIRNLGSTLFGKLHQILLVDKLVYAGKIMLFLLHDSMFKQSFPVTLSVFREYPLMSSQFQLISFSLARYWFLVHSVVCFDME